MAETDSGGCTLVLEPSRLSAATQGAGERDVVGVAYDGSADDLVRRIRTDLPWEPVQQAFVEAYELARSGAVEPGTVDTRVVDQNFAMTRIKRPADAGTLTAAVERFLSDWVDEIRPTSVVVDDLAALADDASSEGVRSFVAGLAGRCRETGARSYVCLDGAVASPRLVEDLRNVVDDVYGEPVPPAEAIAAVERLRQDDPTSFGYARTHWREAGEALATTDRTYAQARQIHAALQDPETTPRSLGMALNALVRLDVLDVWGDTIGANRYDLQAFDRDRLAAVGQALSTQDD